jgi:hypothetical protein
VGPTEPEGADEPTTTDEPTTADEPTTDAAVAVDLVAEEPPPVVVDQIDKPGVDRTTDRRLARLHLRTGARALARVELESLAGVGGLDDEALLDLAEVRWRTDDLSGAGEAALAYLHSGREAPLALVIVAEATAALGRPGEARRLAGRAIELIDGPLDPIFAGMPRSDVWPVDPLERLERAEVPGIVAGVGAGSPSAATLGLVAASSPVAADLALDAPPPAAVVGVSAAGVTAAYPRSDSPRSAGAIDGEAMPDPASELLAARAAIAAGDRDGAAVRLAVVLRLSPALAPAVLDIAAGEPGAAFDLVRGDALRLVGRESQARRSFAAAARSSTPSAPPPGATSVDADASGGTVDLASDPGD